MAQTMGNGNLLNNLEKTKIKGSEKVCHTSTQKKNKRRGEVGKKPP